MIKKWYWINYGTEGDLDPVQESFPVFANDSEIIKSSHEEIKNMPFYNRPTYLATIKVCELTEKGEIVERKDLSRLIRKIGKKLNLVSISSQT